MFDDDFLMASSSRSFQPLFDSEEALLSHLKELAKHHQLLQAVRAQDWGTARHILDTGADLFFNNGIICTALEKQGTYEAYRLFHDFTPKDLRAPFCIKFAAACGEEAWIEPLLSAPDAGLSPEDIADAVDLNLKRKERPIFTKLLSHLIPAYTTTDMLAALAARDFGLYLEKLQTAMTPEPLSHLAQALRQGDAKTVSHFFNHLASPNSAHSLLNPALLSTTLDTLIGLHATGPMVHHYLSLRGQTAEELPELLSAIIRADNISALQALVPDADAAATPLGKKLAILAGRHNLDVDIINHFLNIDPTLILPYVRDDETVFTTALCRKNGDELFFNALEKGAILPEVSGSFLVEALEGGNPKASAFLLDIMKKSPTSVQVHTLQMMQSYDQYSVLKGAVELGGYYVFGERLFWAAAMARDEELFNVFIKSGVVIDAEAEGVADHLDDIFTSLETTPMPAPMLDKLFDRIQWNDDLLLAVMPSALEQPDMLRRLIEKGLSANSVWPGVTENPSPFSGTGGVECLKLLETHGFALPPLDEMATLAIRRNDTAMLDYTLHKGFNPLEHIDILPLRSESVDADNTQLLLKWISRYRSEDMEAWLPLVKSLPAEAFFEANPALTVLAAKAGLFPIVLDKMLANKQPLRSSALLDCKDEYGNTLLDLLGGQGQLNHLLRPELWLHEEPTHFLLQHTPPLFHPQYDFGSFTAARNRAVLRSKAVTFRPKGFSP